MCFVCLFVVVVVVVVERFGMILKNSAVTCVVSLQVNTDNKRGSLYGGTNSFGFIVVGVVLISTDIRCGWGLYRQTLAEQRRAILTVACPACVRVFQVWPAPSPFRATPTLTRW